MRHIIDIDTIILKRYLVLYILLVFCSCFSADRFIFPLQLKYNGNWKNNIYIEENENSIKISGNYHTYDKFAMRPSPIVRISLKLEVQSSNDTPVILTKGNLLLIGYQSDDMEFKKSPTCDNCYFYSFACPSSYLLDTLNVSNLDYWDHGKFMLKGIFSKDYLIGIKLSH